MLRTTLCSSPTRSNVPFLCTRRRVVISPRSLVCDRSCFVQTSSLRYVGCRSLWHHAVERNTTRAWKKGLQNLEEYKARHGHVLVPFRYTIKTDEGKAFPLGSWVQRQRQQHKLLKKGKPSKMTTDRIAALSELGFDWVPERRGRKQQRQGVTKQPSWKDSYEKLKNFQRRCGHCNLDATKKDSALSKWVTNQRRQYKLRATGKPSSLSDERIVAMEELGFVWDASDTDLHHSTWDEWVEMLRQYKDKHGDCLPSTRGQYSSLNKWVAYQRKLYKLLKAGNVIVPSLTAERIEILDDLGFDWRATASSTRTWEDWIELMRQYKAESGDVDAPSMSKPLSAWATRQRRYYRQRNQGQSSPLTEEMIQQLEDLGFDWDVSERHRLKHALWNVRLNDLKLYKLKHGDCLVPTQHESNGDDRDKHSQLGRWVRHQRHQYRLLNEGKPSTMTRDRIAALEELDFEWVSPALKTTWKDWLGKLAIYKEKHGNCRPSREDGYSILADWADQQRHEYNQWRQGMSSSMTAEQIASLLELEFQWDGNDSGDNVRRTLGGNWNPSNPLAWTNDFGRRSVKTEERLRQLVKLQPGDKGYDVTHINVPNVSIVQTKEQALSVMDRLMSSDPTLFHACDVEVMGINIKKEGPVGNGCVTCMSVYSGPDFDYGLGEGSGTVLWIDNLDDASGLIREFQPWLEDDHRMKVWHNYGFAKHVLWNEGIDCGGFGGDTMHMARIQDTSRATSGNRAGYTLEGLMSNVLKQNKTPVKEAFGVDVVQKDDGDKETVTTVIPPVDVMQRDPRFRKKWIEHSSFDAKGIWLLRRKLQRELEKMPWLGSQHMFDFYSFHMRPFAAVLTDMEKRGIRLDTANLMSRVEDELQKDRKKHVTDFRTWASSKIGPDGWMLNPENPEQLRAFLFGDPGTETVFKIPFDNVPFEDMSDLQLRALCRSRGHDVSGNRFDMLLQLGLNRTAARNKMRVNEGSSMEHENELKFQRRHLQDEKWRRHFEELRKYVATYGTCRVLPGTDSSLSKWVKRQRREYWRRGEGKSSSMTDERISALEDLDFEWAVQGSNSLRQKVRTNDFFDVVVTCIGMSPEKNNAAGEPSVAANVIRKLAGNPSREKYGSAYDFFGGGREGHDACVALHNLCDIDVINRHKMDFWTHLESLTDDHNRVHCSINLNTETGRVSSRRPALENQPPDLIRKAFQASPGNNLIVAHYRQLEFRLLASVAECQSMIDLFAEGGDLHSRTAFEMFEHVSSAVDEGRCLLDWDFARGDPSKPLVRDMFESERRIAKDLNFSIITEEAGTTVNRQWGVPLKTAKNMVEKWHELYPEIKEWQLEQKDFVNKYGFARTLFGRYRQLEDSDGRKIPSALNHAGISTPIEGGVADIFMLAMLKLNESDLLRRLGWVILMQMNNEVLLEGPQETAEEASIEVRKCMQKPWTMVLKNPVVPLEVDGSFRYQNWFDAKRDTQGRRLRSHS